MRNFVTNQLGLAHLPVTLGSMAVKFTLECWVRRGIDAGAVLGTEISEAERWSTRLNRPIRRRDRVPSTMRHLDETFATECYHGGRREGYYFGPTPLDNFTDYDLAGAYTTAMAALGVPDYDGIRHTHDVEDFRPDQLGYALVRFQFPPGTRFPCLLVRTQHGLIFPLSGETTIPAPEIDLARRMGAQLEIRRGIIVPWQSEGVRPFEEVIRHINERRKAHDKGSLEERMWKELGNSLYGKLAQGLREKRVFDTRAGEMRDMPPSSLTNPYLAAHITSLVRAVLGEILTNIPSDRIVLSASTDGLLTNATPDEMAKITASGPLCQLFARLRERLVDVPEIVEIKGRVHRVVGVRTSFQFTETPIDGCETILAKGGIQTPRGLTKAGQNEFILEMFVSRDGNTRYTSKSLRPLRTLYEKGGDLVAVETEKRANLDYDWKRRPTSYSMRPIRDGLHLSFDTEPWETVEQFDTRRAAWKTWRDPLKTIGDAQAFDEYCAAGTAASMGLQRSKSGGALKLAQRQFLRAYARDQWGLSRDCMTYAELADWLSAGGFPCTKTDVKNAARTTAKLVPNSVPGSAAVARFIEYVKARFPSFQPVEMLVAQPENREARREASAGEF